MAVKTSNLRPVAVKRKCRCERSFCAVAMDTNTVRTVTPWPLVPLLPESLLIAAKTARGSSGMTSGSVKGIAELVLLLLARASLFHGVRWWLLAYHSLPYQSHTQHTVLPSDEVTLP